MPDGPAIARPDIGTGTGSSDAGSGDPHIRCPHCAWRPGKHDLWRCTCGHQWNTFDTGGVCPGCLHQWTNTQCLKCQGWAPHSAWYQNFG